MEKTREKTREKAIQRYLAALRDLPEHAQVTTADLIQLGKKHKISITWLYGAQKLNYITKLKRGLYKVNITNPEPRHARLLVEQTTQDAGNSRLRINDTVKTLISWALANPNKPISELTTDFMQLFPHRWGNRSAAKKAATKIVREIHKGHVGGEAIETANKETIPPLLKDVIDYCSERDNGIDPHKFYEYYRRKKWTVKTSAGRVPMKSWKASVHTWEKNQQKYRNDLLADVVGHHAEEIRMLKDEIEKVRDSTVRVVSGKFYHQLYQVKADLSDLKRAHKDLRNLESVRHENTSRDIRITDERMWEAERSLLELKRGYAMIEVHPYVCKMVTRLSNVEKKLLKPPTIVRIKRRLKGGWMATKTRLVGGWNALVERLIVKG